MERPTSNGNGFCAAEQIGQVIKKSSLNRKEDLSYCHVPRLVWSD